MSANLTHNVEAAGDLGCFPGQDCWFLSWQGFEAYSLSSFHTSFLNGYRGSIHRWRPE